MTLAQPMPAPAQSLLRTHDLPDHAVALGQDVELPVVVHRKPKVHAAPTGNRAHPGNRLSLPAALAVRLFGDSTQAGVHLVNRCNRRRVAVVGREHVGTIRVPDPPGGDVAEDELVPERRDQLAAVDETVGDGVAACSRLCGYWITGYVGLTVPRVTVSEI